MEYCAARESPSFLRCRLGSAGRMAASCALHLFSALSTAVMRLWFHRFAIGEHKDANISAASRRAREETEEEEEQEENGASCIPEIPREGEPIATLFFLALIRASNIRRHILALARVALHFVCMCCAMLLRYRAMKGANAGGKRVWRGIIRRGRRTGISRAEFGLAPCVSRCIQIVFFPPR